MRAPELLLEEQSWKFAIPPRRTPTESPKSRLVFFFFFTRRGFSRIENKPLQLSPSCYRHARDMFFDFKHFDCVYAHEKKTV